MLSWPGLPPRCAWEGEGGPGRGRGVAAPAPHAGGWRESSGYYSDMYLLSSIGTQRCGTTAGSGAVAMAAARVLRMGESGLGANGVRVLTGCALNVSTGHVVHRSCCAGSPPRGAWRGALARPLD